MGKMKIKFKTESTIQSNKDVDSLISDSQFILGDEFSLTHANIQKLLSTESSNQQADAHASDDVCVSCDEPDDVCDPCDSMDCWVKDREGCEEDFCTFKDNQ